MKRISTTVIGGVALLAIVAFSFIFIRDSLDKNAQAQVTPAESKAPAKKQLWHCGMHPQVIQDHPGDCPICHMALTPFDPGGSGTTAGIQIDPHVVQNMGVRTAEVKKGTLSITVRTVGMMTLPDSGLRDITLKVNGWIQKLYANQEGMHVASGDPLFEVYSPELLVAEQELIAARKSAASIPADASGSASSLVETAKRKLRLWDVSEEEISAIASASSPPKTVTFKSPVSGHVEEKMVVEGTAVTPGMKLLRIADHSSMWLILEVYAEQMSLVKVGQEVTATVDGISEKQFKGKVEFIYPHLDHMARTLKVRVVLQNSGFEIKPGMYATAELHVDGPLDAVLCPQEAVIDTGNRQFAFVSTGDGHFIAKSVRLGLRGDDDKVEILDGLSAGDKVVTSGQFLIDVESRTTEAVMKLSGESATPEMQPMAEGDTPKESQKITQVYCPMVKATWLQSGEEIKNPYMGQAMLSCGEVKGTVSSPAENLPLSAVTKDYLKVKDALTKDSLDKVAMKELADATATLSDKDFSELKDAVSALSKLGDINAAREAFKAVSEKLFTAFNNVQK